jgi:hypothetical protein
MSVHPMSQEKIELDLINSICEAVGCSNKARINLAVRAGPEQYIQLLLCNECVSKFEEGDKK